MIEFVNVCHPAHNVTVYVRVQDTARADAPSTQVAEKVLRRVNILPGSPPLRFKVQAIPQNPHARYVIRVHADVDGNGIVSRGDYVSTQSYPVPSSGQPVAVTIVAREVL
jgi:uncharacterized lipoprotein YbaY